MSTGDEPMTTGVCSRIPVSTGVEPVSYRCRTGGVPVSCQCRIVSLLSSLYYTVEHIRGRCPTWVGVAPTMSHLQSN